MVKYVKDEEWGTRFPNFRKEEFMCNHKSVGDGIYYSLLEIMQKLRNEFGSITISSGYRCPNCNASVGGASNSAHLLGSACDFYIDNGYTENINNRKNLVTRLRKTYNVHYCYCKIDDNTIWDGYNYVSSRCNMGAYIHVDTNPGYYAEPIEEFKIEEVSENSVRISFKPDNGTFDYAKYSLNKQEWKGLPTTNTIEGLDPATKYSLRISLRTKDTPLWTESEELEFTTNDTQKENIPKESTNIPDNTQTAQNEPQKQEIEHNVVEPNEKKTILSVILQFFKYIVQLFKGGK